MSGKDSNQAEQLEEVVQDSVRRGVAFDRQFVSYQFEYNSKVRALEMKEKLLGLDVETPPSASGSSGSSASTFEPTNTFKEDSTVATTIKKKALELYNNFQSLNADQKGIVTLGLNSILDVSHKYPNCQSVLFTNKQWISLKKKYSPVKYSTEEYDHIKLVLSPVFDMYRRNKSFDVNWIALYKGVKKLEEKYDPVLEAEYTDVAFVIFLVRHIMTTIKFSPQLFSSDIDTSEWDYIVKLWGPITERLFRHTDLRLKWGDTHLTMNDTISEASLKVDLRVINDKIKQRYNVEHDVAVMEAAEEDAGDSKFIFDRCKLSIGSKGTFNKYLLDGAPINYMSLVQVSGLGVPFLH